LGIEAGFRERLAVIELCPPLAREKANSGPTIEAAPPVGEPFLAATDGDL
jgi:hypothetical protein